MFRKNDTQKNLPALLIETNVGDEIYKTYYPAEVKELWKINNAPTTTPKTINNY